MKFLFDFAKENGISSDAVTKYIEGKKNPRTLSELEALPVELRKDQVWLHELGETVQGFVWYGWGDYPGRHAVVSLDDLIETIQDNLYQEHMDGLDITELTVEQLESIYVKTQKVEFKVAAILIKNRFSSMLIDW